MGTDDKRLAKIVALLAQAESTTHPEEAKTFTAKAQELMLAWQIDEAMVAQAAADRGAPVRELPSDLKVWIPYSPYQNAYIRLFDAAGKMNGVQTVWLPAREGLRFQETGQFERGGYVHLFGFETGLRLTELLYGSLRIQAETELATDAVQRLMKYEAPKAGHRIRWRNAFLFGYAAAVEKKIAELKLRASQAQAGTEVALRGREVAVIEAQNKVYPKLGTTRSSAGRNAGSGAAAGVRAGARADLGQTRVNNTGQSRSALT